MIREYIKSNKGASLVMVMFYMMILIMLGTTIMALGLSNFKMKLMDEDVKTSLYIAESGLEEAHAIIELEVKNAIDYGNYIVEDNWEKKVDEDYYTYLDTLENTKIDKVKLEEKMEDWFEDAYKEYLTTEIVGKPFDKMTIEEINNGEAPGNYDKELIDKILNASYMYDLTLDVPILEIDKFSGDIFHMKVISTYTPSEGLEKKVSQRFSIKLANKNENYKMPESYFVQYDTNQYNLQELGASGFTDNAITAMGDIIFNQSSKVSIKGNLHANGKNHGILINNGTIEVNKDNYELINNKVSTAKDIRIDGDNINTNFNTNIFCDSLVISEDSNNSKLNIGSVVGSSTDKYRLFTKDDLELNGMTSHINIYGSYYGFSDGSELITEHDSSSAIVINSMDLGEVGGSSLTITGEESKEYKFDDNTTLSDGILIYGTTSIDNLYDENKLNKRSYQTGESVSIIGNYISYTDLVKEYLDDKDNYSYNPYYYFYNDVENLELFFADSYNGEELKVFNSSGKSKTSIIKEVSNNSTGLLTVNGVTLGVDKILHTTGVYVSGGVINNKFQDSYSIERSKISDEYDVMTADGSISLTNEPPNIVNEIYEDEEGNIGLAYINVENTNPITIDNSKPSTITIPSDKEIYGIIISKGDINIKGTIKEFKGVIATQGDIYFEGSGDKHIIYNKEVELIVAKETLNFEDDSNEFETYKNYSDLIELHGWKIEK